MCNWRHEAESVSMKMGGVPIENYFSGDVTSNVPPGMAEPGKCLVPPCPVRLDWQHISQGRYLCDRCFSLVTTNGPYSNCLMCGCPLGYSSIQTQASWPRELQCAVHRGECADYHRALAGVVLGIIPPARRLLPERPEPKFIYSGLTLRMRWPRCLAAVTGTDRKPGEGLLKLPYPYLGGGYETL